MGSLVFLARSYAYSPLVSDSMIKNPEFLELFRKNKKDVAVAKQLTGLEDLWNTKAKANYEKARELADQAASLAR